MPMSPWYQFSAKLFIVLNTFFQMVQEDLLMNICWNYPQRITNCYISQSPWYQSHCSQLILSCVVGSLSDKHLLELSKRITNPRDLQELGLKVLQIEGYKVDLLLITKEMISTWLLLTSSKNGSKVFSNFQKDVSNTVKNNKAEHSLGVLKEIKREK